MNKIIKIWALCFALCSLVVALHASVKADADYSIQKTVSLVLTDGNNTCTVDNYSLGSHVVSSAAQSVTPDTHNISCSLLKSPSYLMTISLSNLTASWVSNGIASTQFTWTFGTWWKNWTLDAFSTTSISFTTNAQTIYTKAANTVWELSGNLTIWWMVPAWQPAWTYTWELNLYIQPNS